MGRSQKEPAEAIEARSALDRALDRYPNLEDKYVALLDEILEDKQVRLEWVEIECKHCARKGKYAVPLPVVDPLKKAQALDKLLSQAKGTPRQTHKVEMNMKVSAARTVADLEQLSDAELALVASSAGAVQAALPIGGGAE